MASLGQLTAGIAHEIKNPLNFVKNFAELNAELADKLQETLAANPETIQHIVAQQLDDIKTNANQIVHHGNRADAIVNAMMLHARGNNNKREVKDLNVLLEQYVDLAYHGMRAQHFGCNVTIKREYDETVGSLKLLPQEIGRVFLNIFNNAFYAVLKKQRDSDEPFAPEVRVVTRRKEDGVEICISYNGPGISSDVQEKMFEPFFTTKPTGEGTGLGLSLAHGIITQGHGGTIRVKSEIGQGAAFFITLPLSGK